MPRVRITSCWPIATMAMTAVWAAMLPRLPGFRKFGVQRLMPTTSSTRMSSGPDAEEPQAEADEARALASAARPSGRPASVSSVSSPMTPVMTLSSCSLCVKNHRICASSNCFLWIKSPTERSCRDGMKTDTVFKRAFNDALDLVAGLEVGESLPSENALSARLGVSRTTVRKVLASLRCAGDHRGQTAGGGCCGQPRRSGAIRRPRPRRRRRRSRSASWSGCCATTPCPGPSSTSSTSPGSSASRPPASASS